MVLGKYRKGVAWWIMYHMKLSCENTQNCEKSHIFSINRSISGTYGLFTCIETSDFGGASHLREILFSTKVSMLFSLFTEIFNPISILNYQ